MTKRISISLIIFGIIFILRGLMGIYSLHSYYRFLLLGISFKVWPSLVAGVNAWLRAFIDILFLIASFGIFRMRLWAGKLVVCLSSIYIFLWIITFLNLIIRGTASIHMGTVIWIAFSLFTIYFFLCHNTKGNLTKDKNIGGKNTMETFFKYWKKGWKVWLMMLCINLSYLLLFIPIALLTIFQGAGGEGTYYFLGSIVGITFAPALTYFVFKSFYGEQ